MLESLQQIGKEVSRELASAWENLSEGWRELLARSGNALTRFTRKGKPPAATDTVSAAPVWGLLNGDVIDTGSDIVVRLELPGVAKDDCDIVVDGTILYIRGEKRYSREHSDGSFYVRQCAFGSFQRAIPLPHNVDPGHASSTFIDGVLIITLPKTLALEPRRITIK
ncbi:MAG: Hsp20/alpha crystallin family protein [Pseudomonadota bacterium]